MTPPPPGSEIAAPAKGAVPAADGERRARALPMGRWLFGLLAVGAIVIVVAWLQGRGSGVAAAGGGLATAVRGDLEIVVLEGGNVKALESLELKSEVETQDGAKILSIVEEGYEVTAEDVEQKKELIRLDPTEIKDRIEAHDIEYENAQAALTEADEERAIQATEGGKLIKVARQTARFALLDLEKYLGEAIATEVLELRGLPVDEASLLAYEDDFRTRLAKAKSGLEQGKEGEDPDGLSGSGNIIDRGEWVRIDFAKFLENDQLGDGEAQQELRKLEDGLLVAQSEFAVEQETVLGSERLADQKFITKETLEKQRVALKKAEVAELSAKTQLELYRRYEFPKKSEELITKYEDALHALDREKTGALAKLSQAEAAYRNAEQVFKIAEKKRKELDGQLESCTIVATKPGLVVYGSSERDRSFGRSEDKIEEGASVRYKQTIITIPDMRRMGVKVSIQESHVKKVKAGQEVRITTDAEPDKILTGEVQKVAVLPDSNRWFENPNQKIYPAEIHIDGTHDWLKPGMSAKAEIITDQLEDVLLIPLQSVMVESGDTVAFVRRGGKPVRQVVEPGGFNDEFIEIVSGLEEGDQVYLSKPATAGGEDGAESKGADEERSSEG